jgi:hypothetical protein
VWDVRGFADTNPKISVSNEVRLQRAEIYLHPSFVLYETHIAQGPPNCSEDCICVRQGAPCQRRSLDGWQACKG